MKTKIKRIIIIAAIIVIGLFGYNYWINTPQYSLLQIQKSVENKDRLLFEKHVDSRKIIEEIVDDISEMFIDEVDTFKLETMFEKSNRLIIKFKESDNRNFAESLRDKEVFVLEDDLPSLDDGEYYLYELVGLKVVNLDNKTLGVVKGSMGTKSNEVLLLEGTSDGIDDKEILIPYIKPQVIKDINLVNKYLLVDWPEDF